MSSIAENVNIGEFKKIRKEFSDIESKFENDWEYFKRILNCDDKCLLDKIMIDFSEEDERKIDESRSDLVDEFCENYQRTIVLLGELKRITNLLKLNRKKKDYEDMIEKLEYFKSMMEAIKE